MKRRCIIIAAGFCTVLLAGCQSGVSQEEYTSLNTQYEDARDEADELRTRNEELEKQVNDLDQEVAVLNSAIEEYKERLEPFEEMEAAEAEVRKAAAEAEKKEAEEKEAEEKKQQEEEEREKQEEAERVGYDTGITYDQLARTPDDYEGDKVKFKGKVIQVMEGSTSTQIRLAVDSNYDQVIYAEYEKDLVSSRVLEDDVITIYGESYGLLSYESTLGASITIPAVIIEKIDQ